MQLLRSVLVLLWIGVTLISCQTSTVRQNEPIAEESFHFDWEALAIVIVQRANIQPGEKVLLVAMPGKFDSLILTLKKQILEKKGEFLGVLSTDSTKNPSSWQTAFTAKVKGLNINDLTSLLKGVNLGIMLPGAGVEDKPYQAMQKVLARGSGRTIHFHWSGAYSVDGKLMEITESIDKFYQDVVLNTDYSRLTYLEKAFEADSREAKFQVTTPSGTDLRFSVGERPVTMQDGDASESRMANARNLIDREIEIPAGAIRVAPIEESVEGKIVFPDGLWNGKPVKGLVMTFENGKVSDVRANLGVDNVKAELTKAGEAGSHFREFALGFNSLLAVPDSNTWIPYYGYGAGVVRLSLGDNSELGGNVTGGYVRWNFFTDATVKIGHKTIVQDGKLSQFGDNL
jgi:hypothetical protein